jgi:hypothetical protein
MADRCPSAACKLALAQEQTLLRRCVAYSHQDWLWSE